LFLARIKIACLISKRELVGVLSRQRLRKKWGGYKVALRTGTVINARFLIEKSPICPKKIKTYEEKWIIKIYFLLFIAVDPLVYQGS